MILVINFIKGQRLQWLGHVMRKNDENTIKVVICTENQKERNPEGGPRKIPKSEMKKKIIISKRLIK